MRETIFPNLTNKSTSFYLTIDAIVKITEIASKEHRSASMQVEHLIQNYYEEQYAKQDEMKNAKL
jgi:predicted transcriptional regulator